MPRLACCCCFAQMYVFNFNFKKNFPKILNNYLFIQVLILVSISKRYVFENDRFDLTFGRMILAGVSSWDPQNLVMNTTWFRGFQLDTTSTGVLFLKNVPKKSPEKLCALLAHRQLCFHYWMQLKDMWSSLPKRFPVSWPPKLLEEHIFCLI